MIYKGLTLDRFQEEAIAAVERNNSVVVSAPTGSGKTLIADYIIEKFLKKGRMVIYTAPIKALSNQKYKQFSKEFGKDNIGLLTGDIVRNPEAQILIMTTEIYRNMALINDEMIDKVHYVIFDEIHYINDIERGYVWEESIIFSKPDVRFLCLSATIPNAANFADWIQSTKDQEVEVVKHTTRSVPLHFSFYYPGLEITTLEEIKEIASIPRLRQRGKRSEKPIKPNHIELVRLIANKTPCLFFSFSRQKCQQLAKELAKKRIFQYNPEISKIIREKLEMAMPEIRNLESTKLLRETLPWGIAFHHAGLIPLIKELVEELFADGLIKVLYATETFAVGINMPAKTVCFEALRKFDGANFRFLNSKEYFQMAGRAGRRGIDKEGFVYAMIERRDFDYKTIKNITDADTEPIKSQFRLSINTVLNLIDQHSQDEIDKILSMNFYTFQTLGRNFAKKGKIYLRFETIKKKLIKMGYVKNNTLTEKGRFSSRIYADEITTGEIFATSFYKSLDEYQIMLLLACLVYEPKEKTEFYKLFKSSRIADLNAKLRKNIFLTREKFSEMNNLSALVYPCYSSKTIFEIIENSSLLEGDLIRFFKQIVDRIGQIRKATPDDDLIEMLDNCQDKIEVCLKGIDEI
ncbi:MAG: DEAD/DEAH box helicase [Candidatus Woesearchaeota archaeon]